MGLVVASLYTLASLSDAIYSRLENNSVFFTQLEVTSVINEAIQITNLFTGFYQGTSRIVSAANQLVYNVPSGILFPQRVTWEGIQLDPIPITRIGQDYINWTTQTTTNYGPVARWIPIGTTLFCINPVDAVGGNDIEVTGIVTPPLLVNSTDSMSLDDQYATIIVEYGASRLPLKIGGANWAQASKLYTTGFQSAMKKLTIYRQFVMPRYWVDKGAAVTEGKVQ